MKLRKPPIKSVIDYQDNWSTPPDGKFYRLTQADIDRPQPEPDHDGLMDWIEGPPGLLFTILLLVVFIAGMWGLWALWQMVSPLATAARG